KFFLSSAGPNIQQSCAFCHAKAKSGAPIFLADTVEGSYVTMALYGGLIAFPENSLLSHHGHHAGPGLTAEQRQVIDSWLKLEMAERAGTQPVGLTLQDALPMIGTCMSLADWTNSGLSALSMIDTGGNVLCSNCHDSGVGGVFLSADAK